MADAAARQENWSMRVDERMRLLEQLRQVAYGYTQEEADDPSRALTRLPRLIEVLPRPDR